MLRITIETKLWPMCSHSDCYGNSCLGFTPVQATATCDLEAWAIHDLELNPELRLGAAETLILRDELLEELERIYSLCPQHEGGLAASATCPACDEAEDQSIFSHEVAHG